MTPQTTTNAAIIALLAAAGLSPDARIVTRSRTKAAEPQTPDAHGQGAPKAPAPEAC